MNLRKSVLTSLLLSIGYIMHQLVPGIVGGMKFDLLLAVVCVCIFLNSDFKNTVLTAILSGFISAMTTTFPGGQIPNIIDKIVTCLFLYVIIRICSRYKKNIVVVGIVSFIATIISGTTFLTSALYIVGLPIPLSVLFLTTVLPTAITNTFITIFIFNIMKMIEKSSNINFMKN